MKLFQDILKAFREQSITEKEKGGKFEQLMKGYLLKQACQGLSNSHNRKEPQ